MEDLLHMIERVRERIKRFGNELQRSEALTRYALIDPILRALGWDTEDLEQVRPEFPVETGKPDYALIWKGKPLIMIEAKRLGTNLREARIKGINYTNAKGVPFFICTDGNLWEIYEVFRPAPLEERRIVAINLEEETPGEAARKLLALWRPAMDEIKAAPPSIVQPSPPPLPRITLDELRAKIKRGDRPPQLVNFPDKQREIIKTWHSLLVATAKWVVPKLQRDQIPIRLGPKRYLLNSTPVHPSGKRFGLPKKINNIWLETGFDAVDSVRFSCRLLETVGISPSEVRVEFQP